jgi:hypothetical protein
MRVKKKKKIIIRDGCGPHGSMREDENHSGNPHVAIPGFSSEASWQIFFFFFPFEIIFLSETPPPPLKSFQMAHMHEIGGKAGAARGTSTPTTQAAKVRPGQVSSFLIKNEITSPIRFCLPPCPTSATMIQIDGNLQEKRNER